MQRPAREDNTSKLIEEWIRIKPDITLRSTYIVGYPGETEGEFQYLLDLLEKIQLDRVGCCKYEYLKGARSNDLPGHFP